MLKGLLCAALAALTLTLAAPLAQGVPDPNGIEFPEGYGGDEEATEEEINDAVAEDVAEILQGLDGEWRIRVGPVIGFLILSDDGSSPLPEAWGDTFEWVSYCYEFAGLDAICGG